MSESKQDVQAIQAIAAALDPLTEEARGRVIAWAVAMYGYRRSTSAPARTPNLATGVTSSPSRDQGFEGFETLAEFFDAADPHTEGEKALVTAFWLQKRDGVPAFDAASVNRELKHLGHPVANITMALNQVIRQKPSLVVQMAKSGKSRQARKKYKVTTAGEKFVEQMISDENDE
jgi:hypothetical protein